MHSVIYKPGRFGGEEIELSTAQLTIGTAPEMRARTWTYKLLGKRITQQRFEAKEVTVDLVTSELALLDALRKAGDADVYAETPGTIIIDGTWQQKAYIIGFEPDEISPTCATGSLTVLLLDGLWRKEVVTSVLNFDPQRTYTDLDYSYDYGHDFAPFFWRAQAFNSSGMPADIKLTIYGAAVNPIVTIGSNRYQVNVSIPQGSRLVIDGSQYPRSITLIDELGNEYNHFSDGVRSGGRGSGSYVFEPLAPGENSITWSGAFSFDLCHYEVESEPPWT